MDLTHPYKVKDYITVTRHSNPFRREAKFPTVLYDNQQIVGISTEEGETIKHPMLGFIIELIRWGYENLQGYREVKSGTKALASFPSINCLPYDYEPRPDRELKGLVFPNGATSKGKQAIVVRTGSYGPLGFRSHQGVSGLEFALCYAIRVGRDLREWDNPVPQFHVDDTPEQLAWLRGRMSAPDFPETTFDSRWERVGGNSERGIHDYKRVVKFASLPSEEHLKYFTKFLQLDKCPGYTEIRVNKDTSYSYTFTTTFDSSD